MAIIRPGWGRVARVADGIRPLAKLSGGEQEPELARSYHEACPTTWS
jgi:hypothetical protein